MSAQGRNYISKMESEVVENEGVYIRDIFLRTPRIHGYYSVFFAKHLEGTHFLEIAKPLVNSIRIGADLTSYVSPMAAAKRAFKKGVKKGEWNSYKNMMDLIRNKWNIYHIHLENSKIIAFIYFCQISRSAYIIDIINHGRDWGVERRLVEIVVENWLEDSIVRSVGYGKSNLTEEDLLKIRKQGVNMPIEVGGRFYLPSSGALMMDGSSYDGCVPLVHVAKRVRVDSIESDKIDSSRIIMTGVDPNDPLSPWTVAAEEAATSAMRRRRAMLEGELRLIVKNTIKTT